jgi:hypothetical protein
MTTNIVIKCPSDEEISKSNIEQHHFLHPPSTTLKPFPQSIIQSIENDRTYHLPHARTTSDFRKINQLSFDTNDDYEIIPSDRKHSLFVGRTHRSPSDIRINVYPDGENEKHNSDLSLIEIKNSKQNRVDHVRRTLFDHRFGRRIHSSFSSSTTLRSINNRRRSIPNYRRQTIYLPRNSKWHFVRKHLHDIAMMNETYARMKLIEQDLRWIHLREEICKRVLDRREMSILRQQDDGKVKKSQKTNFDLKTIPIDEVVHVERDGRVYSIGTRDLVLGRLIGNEEIDLDTFAQLDARRKFQVKQNLLRQQEGRTRLKKYIAFSICLFNLSFIVLMFAAMFIFAMKTIIELKSRQLS